jgi:subtilisin family serine protease
MQGNLWTNESERDGLPWVDDDDNGYIDDIRGYNFVAYSNDPRDDHGHGTAIAGIIAAVGNNETDIAGLCWTARIMPVKVLGAGGDGTAADAVPAIYYAATNGADIISGSWGGAEGSNALRDAIAYAHDEGVVVVAAAGNTARATIPAAIRAISVAATDSNDRAVVLEHGDWVTSRAGARYRVVVRDVAGPATRAGVSRMSGPRGSPCFRQRTAPGGKPVCGRRIASILTPRRSHPAGDRLQRPVERLRPGRPSFRRRDGSMDRTYAKVSISVCFWQTGT